MTSETQVPNENESQKESMVYSALLLLVELARKIYKIFRSK